MSYDNQNIFAKILRGEIPCIKIYEDAHTLSFMDIMPQAEGHTLVIPKELATTLFELSPAAAAATIQTTQKVGQAVQLALAASGIVVMQLNGASAGQTVPHCHFHIIPRAEGQHLAPHARHMAESSQLEAVAARIRAALV